MDDLDLQQAEALLNRMRANREADPVKLLASIALQFIDIMLTKHIDDMKKMRARGSNR